MQKHYAMNKRSLLLLLLFSVVPLLESFANQNSIAFPIDHGKHAESNLERWNFFGRLLDANNHSFGFTLTFLRINLPPQQSPSLWTIEAIYTAYLAISDDDNNKFYYQEKINRSSFNNAGASSDQLLLWNRGWYAALPSDKLALYAQSDHAAIALNLTPVKSPLLYGQNGLLTLDLSTKNDSYFYSLPRLQGSGEIMIENKNYKIINATAWMDHEYQSSIDFIEAADRFTIQLDNNDEISIYILSATEGHYVNPNSFCVVNLANGQIITLKLADFQITQLDTWQSPASNVQYPSGWQLRIPSLHYNLQLIPTVKNQEIMTSITTYWEGLATVTGERDGRVLTGNAHVQLSKQGMRDYSL